MMMRNDYSTIASWITPKSRVLDLGYRGWHLLRT